MPERTIVAGDGPVRVGDIEATVSPRGPNLDVGLDLAQPEDQAVEVQRPAVGLVVDPQTSLPCVPEALPPRSVREVANLIDSTRLTPCEEDASALRANGPAASDGPDATRSKYLFTHPTQQTTSVHLDDSLPGMAVHRGDIAWQR